jgi:hypothetical protein
MSLFNPWVLLGILMTVLGAFGGGYYKGGEDENARQQVEIASLNAAAREREQALVQAVNKQTTQLLKVENNAKIQIAKRDAAISAGTLKLRIPVQAPSAPYIPPQMPPLPPEIAFKQTPNLTERLLNLLSPSQTMETKPSDN